MSRFRNREGLRTEREIVQSGERDAEWRLTRRTTSPPPPPPTARLTGDQFGVLLDKVRADLEEANNRLNEARTKGKKTK